jgi:hypothetical protein
MQGHDNIGFNMVDHIVRTLIGNLKLDRKLEAFGFALPIGHGSFANIDHMDLHVMYGLAQVCGHQALAATNGVEN